MKRAYLTLASLAAPLALGACAGRQQPPAPAPMPSALSAVPTTAPSGSSASPVLASSQAAETDAPAGTSDIAQLLAQRRQAKMKGELPAGHPPISGAVPSPGPAKMNGELPAGHPPISGAQKPAMPGKGSGELPAGHPPISGAQGSGAAGMPGMNAPPASTQPAGEGAIIIRAVQGTAGGPAVGELPAVIELVQGEKVIDKAELKTAADGTLRLDSIPLDMVVTPVAKVTYQGVEYTATGQLLDAAHAEQQLQVTVYETTEQAPQWRVSMQHVMLEPTVEGVQVSEMLSVENPGDRAWVGTAGADGKRRTISFPLPAGATDVKLSGALHDCCVTTEDGKILDSMALIPGVSQYRIAYTLPVKAGKADLAFTTIAPVKHLMIFVPDDGSVISAEGIGSPQVTDMGGGKTRFFRGTDVAAGAAVKLNVSGITARAAATASQASTSASSSSARSASSGKLAKTVAGVGGLAIFVVGGMLLMFKAPRARKA